MSGYQDNRRCLSIALDVIHPIGINQSGNNPGHKRNRKKVNMSLKPEPKPAWNEPSQESLEAQALDFFKRCKPKEYREMKKDGSLREVCQLRARAAKRYAENLIQCGVWEREAWNMAVRQEILESETD